MPQELSALLHLGVRKLAVQFTVVPPPTHDPAKIITLESADVRRPCRHKDEQNVPRKRAM